MSGTDDKSIDEVVNLYQLRWSEHLLLILIHHNLLRYRMMGSVGVNWKSGVAKLKYGISQ